MPREGTLWREGEDTIHDPKLEKLDMTKKQKRQNFWFYYKWHVIIGVLVVLVGGFLIYDLLDRTEYDYTIGLMTEESVPIDVVSRMETLIAEKGEDLNGDGQVLVHVENYVIVPEDGDANDPYVQMASMTKLSSDVSTMQSVLFFSDEKSFEKFQNEESPTFSYLDGTTPKNGADDYENMRLPWEEITALSSADWTFEGKDDSGNAVTYDVSDGMKEFSLSIRVIEGTQFADDEAKQTYYQKNIELLNRLKGEL